MNTPAWFGPALAAAANKALNGTVAHAGSLELITADQLAKCTDKINNERCIIIAGLINELAPAYGIKTKDALHEFLANVLQESDECQLRVENLNYKPETLHKVWPKHFPTIAFAQAYAHNPTKLGNYIYGLKLAKDLGNRPGTNDGYDLRGSGWPGLTGRYCLTAFAKYKGLVSAEAAAEYARSGDRGALEAALWFFCILKHLIDEAEADNMIGIVKEWNGGTIGLNDRLYYYELLKKYVV